MLKLKEITEILSYLKENEIDVWVEDGHLEYEAPVGAMTDEFISLLRENKTGIIEFLSKNDENYKKKGIEAIELKESYELSHSQKRLWVLDQLQEDSIAYNMPLALTLKGKFNEDAFKQACSFMLTRHESLRTVFITENGEPKQKIQENSNLEIEITDLRNSSDAEAEAKRLADKDIQTPFNLEAGPLVRFTVLRLEEEKFVLLFNMHHIISDGWSKNLFIKEFLAFYECFNKGITPCIQPLGIHYKDYSAWQNELLKSSEINRQKEYWLNKFSGDLPVLDLPSDNVRPVTQTFNGTNFEFVLSKEICNSLNNLCFEKGISLFMLLQALVKILFHRYTGQEDIILGSPVAGRVHEDLENQIGLYVNTLCFRDTIKGNVSFKEFLTSVKKTCIDAFDNQDYPFDALVDELDLIRDVSRSPLFDVMVILHNNETTDAEFEGLNISQYSTQNIISKFDMTFHFNEGAEGLFCGIEYNTDIYSEDRINRLAEHFKVLTSSILENPESKIQDLEIIPEGEKNQLLNVFNDTKAEYQKDKTIIDLFEKQVRATPEQTALTFEGRNLSYKELNSKANIVAHYLKDTYNLMPHDLVGVLLHRSEYMIIALLGILKSGAAYIPLDPQFPEERVEYMLEDSVPKLVLSDRNQGIYCDIKEILTSQYSIENPPIVTEGEDPAYIIYTSGSTGKPKGTVLTHRSVLNFIQGVTDVIDFNSKKSIVSVTTFSFDIFVLESFLALSRGLRVVLANDEEVKDPFLLAELMKKEKVNMIQTTPSRIKMLTSDETLFQALTGLSDIMVGGEAFPEELLLILQKNCSGRIYNMYGPTETTVWSSIADLTRENRVHIGKPISNTLCYVLDKSKNQLPIGIAGELCISGDGLARGYLNRPELTAEKFVSDPFLPEQKMYKTGDLARWLPDGNIEFLGRIDNQVKIRGYRIEPGEIESTLNQLEEVQKSIVIVKDTGTTNSTLNAYVVLNENVSNNIESQLKAKLPHYMIPSVFHYIDEIPLMQNGKVDRKKLLSLEKNSSDRPKLLPRNYHENIIAEIWQEILSIEEAYVEDDFFALGGNSINIIQVANKIREILEIDLPIADLMVYRTIQELSDHIQRLEQSDYRKLKYVFKINKSTSPRKLFIFHGGDADIYYYRYLAKELENEFSVYGIQPEGLVGNEPLPTNYYEMMNNYIEEIRQVQEEGPYIFAGYCIGGYFANNIAKLFEIQGTKIEALIHLNMEAFISTHNNIGIVRYTLALRALDIIRRVFKKDKSFPLEQFRKRLPKMPPMTQEEKEVLLSDRKLLNNYFSNEMAVTTKYMPFGYIKSPILWIRAKEDTDSPKFDMAKIKKMIKGPAEIHDVPGAHKTVLLPPHVTHVARVIKEYFAK